MHQPRRLSARAQTQTIALYALALREYINTATSENRWRKQIFA